MHNSFLSRLAQVVTLCAALPLAILANSSGPPAKHSGAPGDRANSCAASGCHVGTALNGGGGNVALTLPGGATYTPGAKQTITVKITQPGAAGTAVYGYQASVRAASNPATTQAGRLTPLGTDIVVCEDDSERSASGNCRTTAPLEYVEHSRSSSSDTFTFEWTAPATDIGDVIIYVAGNAANGNRSNSGDRIYTTSVTLRPAAANTNRPSITASGGVANGASFAAGVVAGSWTSIFGQRLASGTKDWTGLIASDGSFPTSIDGVSVSINGQPAFINFISANQINVQAPGLTATGPVSVTVTTPEGTSESVMANVAREQPGLFLFTQAPKRFPAVVRADGVFIAPAALFGSAVTTVPARPGDTLLFFGTGFGPTTPSVPAGRVFSGAAALTDAANLRMTIGGVSVTPAFAGLSGAGLYQFNVVVPASLTTGEHPVTMSINGVSIQSDVLLAVQR